MEQNMYESWFFKAALLLASNFVTELHHSNNTRPDPGRFMYNTRYIP